MVALQEGAGAIIGAVVSGATGFVVTNVGKAASAATITGEAICADGDCSNEAVAVREGFGEILVADGDPTNEVQTIIANAQKAGRGLKDLLMPNGQPIGREGSRYVREIVATKSDFQAYRQELLRYATDMENLLLDSGKVIKVVEFGEIGEGSLRDFAAKSGDKSWE